jgi:hypothetical protein
MKTAQNLFLLGLISKRKNRKLNIIRVNNEEGD